MTEYTLIAYPSILPHKIYGPTKKLSCLKLLAKFYKILYNRKRTPLAIVSVSDGCKFYEWLIPFANTTELETKHIPKIGWEENRCDIISVGDR